MKWAPAGERFWAAVDKSGECWLWTHATAGGGYGDFWDGRKWPAHRWAYTQANGPIPDGLQLDHLCRTRNCVRPSHLEAVTQAENIRRGQGTARKHTAHLGTPTPRRTPTGQRVATDSAACASTDEASFVATQPNKKRRAHHDRTERLGPSRDQGQR